MANPRPPSSLFRDTSSKQIIGHCTRQVSEGEALPHGGVKMRGKFATKHFDTSLFKVLVIEEKVGHYMNRTLALK